MKNLTFAIGLSWLIYGALFFGYPDWDIGVSLVMAISTYFAADWVIGVIRRLEYRQWLKAAFLTWFSVDGCYTAYWLLIGKPDNMVEGQWMTSLYLFLLCGTIWTLALPMFQEVLDQWRSRRAVTDQHR